MQYAILRDSKIVQVGVLRELFPTATFPLEGPDEEFMQSHNVVQVLETVKHDSAKQKLVYCDPYLLDGKVYRVEAKNFTSAEITANKKAVEEFLAMQGGN